MNKKKLFLWCLYDFANSVVFINFLVYFSKWLVIDGGLSDFAYNSVFAISAGLLLFSAPALAAYTDKFGGRKRFLNFATIGTMASYAAAALSAIYSLPLIFSFLFFLMGQYFFQLAFVFFDPMINDISTEKHRAKASGIVQFCSSAGMIVGLAIFLPLAGIGRLTPLLPAVGLFAILALPMMIFYREQPLKKISSAPKKLSLGFDWKKFKLFICTSPAAIILLAFFFYNDALVTITNNYSIYAGQVLSMSDQMTSVILIVLQIMAAVGALLAGYLADKIGVRKCLFWILGVWLAIIPLISVASSMGLFFGLAILLGMTIGAGWTISRAYISLTLAQDEVGYGFSFYTIFERFSSIIGPLAWGGILLAGGGYRLAMFSMTLFIAIGLAVLWRSKK